MANASASSVETAAIVDQVLELIKDTDSGASASPAQREAIDALLERLEEAGAAQQPRPLANPLLWGNYVVAYTSTGRATKQQQRGEPAGGRFRGRIGRSLFRTTGLFQSVLQPDLATNKVCFRLFGMLPGAVGLRGKVLPLEGSAEGQGGQPAGGDTVQVLFEPPVLSVAGSVHMCIGGWSSVQLSTTYLDERVRLGKGSRGSLFVFTRGGEADAAGMDQVGLQRTSPLAAAAFAAFLACLILGGVALWAAGAAPLKAAAVALWALCAAIGGVVRRGGLVMDRDDEAMAAALKAELERRRRRAEEAKEGGAAATPAAA